MSSRDMLTALTWFNDFLFWVLHLRLRAGLWQRGKRLILSPICR